MEQETQNDQSIDQSKRHYTLLHLWYQREVRRQCAQLIYLWLEIAIDHVQAVQVGEGQHYLRCVELPLVVGESARSLPRPKNGGQKARTVCLWCGGTARDT